MAYVRNIRFLGLALSAMLLIGGLAAANASAAEWKLNGSKIIVPVFTEESGSIELIDEAGGPFGEQVGISCNFSKNGTAGPGTADTTTAVSGVLGCVTVSGTCGSPKASAVNLPWKTELFESAGILRDRISSGGGGPPGYKFECTFFGILATDTCTSEAIAPRVEKGKSPVPLQFDLGSGAANCTRGGLGKGRFRGSVKVSSGSGTLTVG